MFKKTSTKINQKSKVSLPVIYGFWVVSMVLAVVVGWSAADNLWYANTSQVLTAEVVNKSSYRSKTNNSKHYSTSYTVTYQFENPNVEKKFELKSELAPLVYPLVEKGEFIEIYYNELGEPKSKIKMLHHYWLLVVIWLIVFYFIFLITRTLTKTHAKLQEKFSRFKLVLMAAFVSPILLSFVLLNSSVDSSKQALAMEKNWPSWPALERAVPKPTWWDKVSIKYFDPMNYTSEEYTKYLKANTGSDKRHRQFKVAYAFLLKHQNDPLQMGWDLAKGTTREFMPLYEFFLEEFMYTQWQGDCSQPCSDATQMVEMAGDLLSMKLDENQIEYSRQLIKDIMKYKYERANNRGKYYFLYSYRRLLEHTDGKEKAHQVLDGLVEQCQAEAVQADSKTMIRKWSKFWSSSQRKVGMFNQSGI